MVGPRRRPRVLPLSDYAAEVLGAWAEEQARRGGEWLFDHAPRVQGGLLRLGRRPAISVSFVHEIMRAAVTHAFPLPQQRALRRRLTAGGLADLYRIRLVGSRLPVHLVVELLGVDRVSHLRRYTTPVTLARLHREWRRLIARRRWI